LKAKKGNQKREGKCQKRHLNNKTTSKKDGKVHVIAGEKHWQWGA